MESEAIQSGPAVLKAMPIIQKTNLVPTEHFDLSEKMPGMTSVQNMHTTRMTGVGQIMDVGA